MIEISDPSKDGSEFTIITLDDEKEAEIRRELVRLMVEIRLSTGCGLCIARKILKEILGPGT